MWNLVSVCLEMVIFTQDRCMVCLEIGARFVQNVPYTQKSFWMLPMLLLGDEAQVEAHFGLFGDSAKLYASYVHGLRRMYHKLGNHFGRN
jgi:hypothetical protein